MKRSVPGTALALAAALCTLASGCAPQAQEAVAWRWIETAPIHAITAADFRALECPERFEFADGSVPPGLRIVDGVATSEGGPGLTMRGGLTAPRLALREPQPATGVEAVRVVLAGLRRGQVRLIWSGPGGGGEVSLPKSAGTGALRDHFLLDLPAAARAPGELRLELEPTTAAGELVTLSELCLGRFTEPAARLESAAQVAWKATLEAEARDVLLVPAAGEVVRSGHVAAAARIEFGLGRIAGTAVALRLAVEERRTGVPVAIRMQRRIEGAELAGWLDFSVDLTGPVGREAELAIVVRAEEASPDFVTALSAPRVRDTARRDSRPNVVLISIDTLRADHLSLQGYSRATSPRLDAWARRHATVFSRAVTPASWTLPAHFSLFTGLESFAHPANYNSIAIDASAYRFLAEQLGAAGYRTVAITGGSFVTPDYGLARGFERFRYWESKERRDEELAAHLERANRFLDGAGEEPFFLFFHTYEVHTPNGAREPWFSRFRGAADERVVDLGPPVPPRPEDGFVGGGHFVVRSRTSGVSAPLAAGEEGLPRDAYDSAIAYVDDQLGPLLERLVQPPFAGRTVIALVSDHGESLGDGGRAGHTFLSLDNLMVPLILVTPDGGGAGRAVPSQVRLHDLHPTLLELAGEAPPEGIDGRTLLPLVAGGRERGRPAFTYAAPTNFGLGLLSPEGLKLEWRNVPWRAVAGQLAWSRVAGFDESPLDAAPAGEAPAALAREIETAYAGRAPGLRVELVNPGPEPIAVELTTELIDPVSMKTPALDAAPLDWLDVGRLRGEIPAGRTLSLHFERIPRREVTLAVTATRAGCREASRAAIHDSVERLRAARTELLAAGDCPDGGARPPVRLSVRWQGPAPSSSWSPTDEALQEELRALGYLN